MQALKDPSYLSLLIIVLSIPLVWLACTSLTVMFLQQSDTSTYARSTSRNNSIIIVRIKHPHPPFAFVLLPVGEALWLFKRMFVLSFGFSQALVNCIMLLHRFHKIEQTWDIEFRSRSQQLAARLVYIWASCFLSACLICMLVSE